MPKNVVANILLGLKGRCDKLLNRGLLRIIRQINPLEAQEIQLESGRLSDRDVHTLLPLKSLVSDCSQ